MNTAKSNIEKRIAVLNNQTSLYQNYIYDLQNEIEKIKSSLRVANYSESIEKINKLEDAISYYKEQIEGSKSEKELLNTLKKETSFNPRITYPLIFLLFLFVFIPFIIKPNITGFIALNLNLTNITKIELNTTINNPTFINLSNFNLTGDIVNFSVNDSSYTIEIDKIPINTSETGTKELRIIMEKSLPETDETTFYAVDFTINIFDENLDSLKEQLRQKLNDPAINIKSLKKQDGLYNIDIEFPTKYGKTGYISIYGVKDITNITSLDYLDTIQYIIKNEK